jgi:hypothetical protein
MMLSAVVAVVLPLASAASAGAIDEVMKLQRNGMWEMKPPGYAGKPYLFCVTDTTKIGGLRETQQAVAGLGCRMEKDVLKGDQYEIVLNCGSANPEVGNFRMEMRGTARADYQSGTTAVTGGGRMVRSLFPGGKGGGGESRWLRPCAAHEKPGLQEGKQ